MQHENQVAKHVAEQCLNFKIYFNETAEVVMELGGQKWTFEDKTDAQAVDRISEIFTLISAYMWRIVNEKVLQWVRESKRSFN